jgi:hypothetical protein
VPISQFPANVERGAGGVPDRRTLTEAAFALSTIRISRGKYGSGQCWWSQTAAPAQDPAAEALCPRQGSVEPDDGAARSTGELRGGAEGAGRPTLTLGEAALAQETREVGDGAQELDAAAPAETPAYARLYTPSVR